MNDGQIVNVTAADKIFRAFSFKRNLNKLFSSSRYETEEKDFEIFNAFKVLSITLIVLGNTYFYSLSGPIQNVEVVSEIFNTKWFMVVSMADMQVDVFYWITGFTMSFHLLRRLKANNGTWWAHPGRVFFERVFRL